MPQLISREVAWRIIALREQYPEATKTFIARETNTSRHAVRNCIKRHERNGDPEARVNHGRQQRRTLSAESVQQLVTAVEMDPFSTPRQLKSRLNLRCSETTISRRLKDSGIDCYRPARKPKLSAEHRAARLVFARNHSDLDWSRVMFSDESTITSAQGSGVNFVRRPRGTRYEENYIQETKRSGRESVHLWAYFTREGPGDLVRVIGKLNSKQYNMRILSRHVTPYFNTHAEENPRRIFQHDNSPVHTAGNVKRYIESKGIEVLNWPPASPDLSPIENYWNVLKREIGEIELPAGAADVKKDYLWGLVQEKWEYLKAGRGPAIIENYYSTMGGRMREVINKAGGPTKY